MADLCSTDVTGARMRRVARMITAASKGAGPSGLREHGTPPWLVADVCTEVLTYMHFGDGLGVRGARGDSEAWGEFIGGILPHVRQRVVGVCPVGEYSDAWACHVEFALALVYGL